MITHVVVWRVKEGAFALTKPEILQKAKADLEALPGLIPGILSFQVVRNEKPAPQASDLALVSVFESWAALEAYIQHPAHQEVAAFLGQIVEERRVVDAEH